MLLNSRDQYQVFGNSKECHVSHHRQYLTKSLVKSPSESTLYYPSNGASSPPSYSTFYHHHHQSYQTSIGQCSDSLESSTSTANGSSSIGDGTQHYCAYSTVQISSGNSAITSATTVPTNGTTIHCDKSRCCCKRQRTITDNGVIYTARSDVTTSPQSSIHLPQCSSCTLVMNAQSSTQPSPIAPAPTSLHVIPPPPPPSATAALFATTPAHLDQVTSAMTNSIRILQEVREKEEKLVEASRKLNEEHQKLCREKEKLKLYDFERYNLKIFT